MPQGSLRVRNWLHFEDTRAFDHSLGRRSTNERRHVASDAIDLPADGRQTVTVTLASPPETSLSDDAGAGIDFVGENGTIKISGVTVPEPSSLVLTTLCGLSLLARMWNQVPHARSTS
jgi:hypothetical protein